MSLKNSSLSWMDDDTARGQVIATRPCKPSENLLGLNLSVLTEIHSTVIVETIQAHMTGKCVFHGKNEWMGFMQVTIGRTPIRLTGHPNEIKIVTNKPWEITKNNN